jgi:hypothetical protein
MIVSSHGSNTSWIERNSLEVGCDGACPVRQAAATRRGHGWVAQNRRSRPRRTCCRPRRAGHGPRVADRQAHRAIDGMDLNADDSAGGRELDGVANQVRQHLEHPIRICVDAQIFVVGPARLDALCFAQRRQHCGSIGHELADGARDGGHVESARLDLREIQQVVYQGLHAFDRALDSLYPGGRTFVSCDVRPQQRDRHVDHLEWILQIMRHHGDQLVAQVDRLLRGGYLVGQVCLDGTTSKVLGRVDLGGMPRPAGPPDHLGPRLE